MADDSSKARVREHWEREVCGARYGDSSSDVTRMFEEIDITRHQQDYMLRDFARFSEAKGKRVLEVGLGTGSDFANWVRNGADAYGRDLTVASVEMTRHRLQVSGLEAEVETGDAEALDFPDDFFDLYYSWGVLHHSPDIDATFAEAHRVLKPGGTFKVMLYHYPSVGMVLFWLAQGPLRGRFAGPRTIIGTEYESPGTKVFTVPQARKLVGKYFRPETVKICTYLGSGDLLTQRSAHYSGSIWRAIQAVYPRWFVKRVLSHRFGTAMTIEAVK